MDSVLLIKIISALLYPLGLVLLLGVLGALCRWRYALSGSRFRQQCSRFFLLSAVVILLLSSNPMVARGLASSLERQYAQQPLNQIAPHDAIIVLGGGVRIPTLPAQYTQLGGTSDRYWHAARLFFAGKASRIILSGGNVYKQPGFQGEAYYASELLQQWGVPEAAILFESGSRTTAENQQRTTELLANHQIESALLVTSALHMPRAYHLFEHESILITPASADVIVRQQHAPTVFAWLPSASALQLTTVALHEYYGLGFNKLKKAVQR